MSSNAMQVREAGPSYVTGEDAQDVPRGCQQSDVGIKAEEWDLVSLRQISNFITKGATPTTYGFKWAASGIPFLRSECVSPHGLDLGQSMFISPAAHEMLQRSEVRDGDLLVTITGNVGRVVLLQGVGVANINQHIARVRISACNVDPRFVYHVLSQVSSRRRFESIITGQAYPQISLQQVRDARVALPRLPEQRAIAEALSNVDGLLRALEALIAKKRAIKQAAMQQLLTGRTRLPGFSGKWETKRFSDLLRHHSGNSALIKGKLSNLPISDYYPAYSASGQDVWTEEYAHSGEALVVSAVGSRCGKAFLATDKWSAVANTHVVWPIPGVVDIRFLRLFLDDEGFWLKSGTGQPYVLFAGSFARAIEIPRIAEQIAIATALSDMDAEIAALEARRDKTRAIKQGMMQQLLTGRVRLIEPEAAA